jgi:hypothetical protein
MEDAGLKSGMHTHTQSVERYSVVTFMRTLVLFVSCRTMAQFTGTGSLTVLPPLTVQSATDIFRLV